MRIFSGKFGKFERCRTRNKKCTPPSFTKLYLPATQEVWPGSLLNSKYTQQWNAAIDIRGSEVRLGITASRCIPAHRREVYEAIHRKRADKTK